MCSERATLPGRHSTYKRSLDAIEERGTSELVERGSSFPGFGYIAGIPVTPGLIFKGSDFNRGPSIFDKYSEKIDCKNCLSCEQFNEDSEEIAACCGCTSMDYVWEYDDMPACDTCNPDDGTWPGTTITINLKERSTDEPQDDEIDGSKEYHILDTRASGTATLSPKPLTVCGQRLNSRGDNRYPSFPAKASWPWDGIENGRWDSISRYWGNESAVCSDWSVTWLTNADTVYIGTTASRAKYQSMYRVFHDVLSLQLTRCSS